MQTNSLGNGRNYQAYTRDRSDNQEILQAIGTSIHDSVCLDLGYSGGHRLIVPQNVYLSKAGNLLVHAERRVDGELVTRNYRVDRITSADVIGLTAKNMIQGALGVALIEAAINSESSVSTPPE